jgi:hypothetical protein
MSRSQAQTRFDLIDPALEQRGWSRRGEGRRGGAEVVVFAPCSPRLVGAITFQLLLHRPAAFLMLLRPPSPLGPLAAANSHSIDYVVTHELCHLVHGNHGKEFFTLLRMTMPDWEARKARLESIMAA